MPAKTASLDTYNRKRDFSKTREPAGKIATRATDRFVIQKHHASRLHWDFRLEIDGVLVSWAVPKGPSANPDEKRLAVRTEDHPLGYAGFEGEIPAGEYGAGHVIIWDEGKWEAVGLPAPKQLAKGHIRCKLAGARLRGLWDLVRMAPRKGEKSDNWLLVKAEDDFADPARDLVAEFQTSVRAKALALPAFQPLQLATLYEAVPQGDGWLHEIKYDGYRCLLAVAGGAARAYTRSGLDWSERFAPVVEAARTMTVGSALIDGEIVVLDNNGRPDFSALQAALKARGEGLSFVAFDLLERDGASLKALPLIARKAQLAKLLANAPDGISYADHVVGDGEPLLASMCAAGLEGIISKRCDAPYTGRRSKSWVKVKCGRREEFVIVGWIKSDKKGRPFASLALGQYEGKALVYRGRVGTGFTVSEADAMMALLDALPKAAAPEGTPPEARRNANWVAAKLVAEVEFAEFTGEGLVRHARFVGLREDKPVAQVKKEKRMSAAPDASADEDIRISNPQRIVFPDDGITKGDVADYYRTVAPLMMPSTAGRPISLIRCPSGIASACFFQRHESAGLDEHVRSIEVPDSEGEERAYLYVDDAPGLLACVQMGTIEFHGWAGRVDDMSGADRIVFDLDPDERLDFADVRRAAFDLRDDLAAAGLKSRPMLSGGKGVHVIVPLSPVEPWDVAKAFAHGFAEHEAETEPERYTASIRKAKRKGRIFIDWLRNQKSATSVEPYSLRARPGAPVAAPLDWHELKRIKSPARWTIKDAARLVARAGDLEDWQPVEQSLAHLRNN